MIETRSVAVCGECQSYWFVGHEPAKCTNLDHHQHQMIEVHRHHSVVALPDGTEITAVSFDPIGPYTRDEPPGYGLYLDYRWQPPWTHDHVDWPDFGVPVDAAQLVAALGALLERARGGERVEIGCLGGHGRTGTALACLAVLSGHPHGEAVAWVRENYCADAVETAEQEAFVAGLDG